MKIIPEYSRCQPGGSSYFFLKKNERIQAPDISSTSGDDNSSEDFTIDSMKMYTNSSKQIADRDSKRERVEILPKMQFETHSEDEELLLKNPEKELLEDTNENSPPSTIPETDSIQFNTDSDTDSGFKSENDCVRKSPFNNDFELSDDASENLAIDSPKSAINIDEVIKQEEIVVERTIESEDKQIDSLEETGSKIVINSNIVDPSAMYLNLEGFNSSFGSDESYFNIDENLLKFFSGNKLERNLSSDKESSSSSTSLEQSEEKSPMKGLDSDFLLFDSPFYNLTRNDPHRDRDPYLPYLPSNLSDLFTLDNPDLKMIDPSTIWLSQNNTSTIQHKSNIEESSPLTPYTMDNEFTTSETLTDYVESLIDSFSDSYQKQSEDNEQIVSTLLDDFPSSKIFDLTKTETNEDSIENKAIAKESETNTVETIESLNVEKSNVPFIIPTNIVDNKEEDTSNISKTLDTVQKHQSDISIGSNSICVTNLNYKISSFSQNSKKRKRTDPVKMVKPEERLSSIFAIFPNPAPKPLIMKNAFENSLKPQYNQNSKRLRSCDVSPDSSPCSPSSLSPSENSQTICSFQNFSETKMHKNKRIETSIPIETKSSMKSFLDKEVVYNANKAYKYSFIKQNR